jgi:hypothetical protein
MFDASCMISHLHRSLAVALALLLLPTVADACPIPFRTIGPVKLQRHDVRRPTYRAVDAVAWRVGSQWTFTTPELNQELRAHDGRSYDAATFPRQQALSIDAAAPDDNGWVYADDSDPHTPPCELAGRSEWQQPVIMLRQDAKRVRIAAAARRTVGSRAGCVLGGGDQQWSCPTLTRRIILLKRPLGDRELVFEAPAATIG